MTASSPMTVPFEPSAEPAVEPSAEPARPRKRDRAARALYREEFDALVRRDYAVLVAEAVLLTDDRRRAVRLVRRALAALWRDWARVREQAPSELVRERLHQDTAKAGRGGWWRRRPAAGTRPGADTLVALRAMPRVQRRALVLRHGAGRSLERIAAVEGASAHSVRLRLAHGAHALAHHHPATPTIPITISWAELQRLEQGEADAP